MRDQYTEVTHTSYFGNAKNALAGFLFGILFFIGSFFLLGWNEGNSVRTHNALNWAQAQMVPAQPSPLDHGLNDKIVYLAGDTATTAPLTDSMFDVSANDALRLRRTVEMYQWKENRSTRDHDTLGGGTDHVTTYTYDTVWSKTAINSSDFHRPAGHQNPAMPFSTMTVDARDAKLGDYQLTQDVLVKLDDFSRRLPPPEQHGDFHSTGEMLYKGQSPDDPRVGDIRITFAAVPADEVSIIGQQVGNTIRTAPGPSGKNVLLVETGLQPAESMFANAHRTASLITWAIRAGGFFLMFLGLRLMVEPVRALIGFVPFARPLLNMGLGIISALVALPLTAATIAIAWLAYRPLFSLGILGGGALLAVLLFSHRRSRMNKGMSTLSDSTQTPIATRG